MKRLYVLLGLASCLLGSVVAPAQAPTAEEMWEIIQQQQAEIERLKQEQDKTAAAVEDTDNKVEATADALEQSAFGLPKSLEWASKTSLGGYAELHYNNFDNADDEVDAHRFVIFLGYEFNQSVRFISELELEHSIAGEGQEGEIELEQAYIEWRYTDRHALQAGLFLLPIGILNETHEPNTFYGVERNLIERNIIPTTWWETGAMFSGELAPGLSYNLAIHSGLENDGINIRSGRQKSSEAIANDFAYTGRLKYTAIPGLELAASLQYQEDITQGLLDDEPGEDTTSSGTLAETHVVYRNAGFAFRALYAQWDIDGDIARDNGRDKQTGWYLEPSYKPIEQLGFFVRYSEWDNTAGVGSSEASEVIDYGVNYWLTPQVVFKADFQDASDYNRNDSVNLGVGWLF